MIRLLVSMSQRVSDPDLRQDAQIASPMPPKSSPSHLYHRTVSVESSHTEPRHVSSSPLRQHLAKHGHFGNFRCKQNLAGGDWNIVFHILGVSSSHLIHIFQRGWLKPPNKMMPRCQGRLSQFDHNPGSAMLRPQPQWPKSSQPIWRKLWVLPVRTKPWISTGAVDGRSKESIQRIQTVELESRSVPRQLTMKDVKDVPFMDDFQKIQSSMNQSELWTMNSHDWTVLFLCFFFKPSMSPSRNRDIHTDLRPLQDLQPRSAWLPVEDRAMTKMMHKAGSMRSLSATAGQPTAQRQPAQLWAMCRYVQKEIRLLKILNNCWLVVTGTWDHEFPEVGNFIIPIDEV